MPIFALYNFNDTGAVAADSALENGAQDGGYYDGATPEAGRVFLDGVDDKVKIQSSPEFDLPRGTLEIQFSQSAHVGDHPNTVLSRDSAGETEGGYRIEVMPDGSVRISHESAGDTTTFQTDAGFVNPDDEVNVVYSWDVDAGGSVQISNLTTDASFEQPVPAGLTMDQDSPVDEPWTGQPWMIGAGQSESDPGTLNNLDNYFQGSVEVFSLSDTVDNALDGSPVANPDTAETDEDTLLSSIPVLDNDTDPDGDPLSIVGTPTAENGTVGVNADGSLNYMPDQDFFGTDTITYTITDPDGNESSSTVTVTVHPVNDAPEAVDDIASTGMDQPVVIDLIANDVDVDNPNSDLLISGVPTSADGTVTVNPDGRSVTFTPNPGFMGNAVINYTVTDPDGLTDDGIATVMVGQSGPDGIVRGTDGDDLIDLDYIDPYDGDRVDAGDAIIPGDAPNDDRIVAGAGNDTVYAGLGDDTVYGGTGDDLIHGGTGDDVLHGDEGDDTLYGEHGDDLIYGGTGDDLLYGGDGDDTLYGGAGDDELYGGEGDDYLVGGAGDDTLHAGTGENTLVGGQGDDILYGGVGDDTLYAGEGDNFLYGGHGNDVLYGGPGADTMYGGAGRDDFHITAGEGAGGHIYGGSEGDDHDRLIITGPRDSYRVVETGPDSDGNGINGRLEYLDEDGNITGIVHFENIEEIIPICFTPGTLIATPKGEVPVESLKAGDRVITRDNGIQEISWIGGKKMDWAALTANPHLRPIMIRRGSLGNGLPERDMMVSPNHRVLVSNDRTSLYFDEREVLVAAKHLIGGKGVFQVESIGTTYIHLMFDQHEVVLSDGAWTESFQPGDYSMKGMGNAQRNEILELFPELKTKEGLEDYSAARRTLKKHEAKLLVR